MINITFNGHHLDVTPALKTYSAKKLETLKHHFDNMVAIHMTYDVEKLQHIAEATIFMSHKDIHAQGVSVDMYAAVDDLVDKLDKQLLKHKGKQQAHRDGKS